MQQKPIIQYFLRGFALANRSLDLFFIGLFLSLGEISLNSLVQNPTIGFVFTILSFVIFSISQGFLLSMPVFLVQKQEKKPLDKKHLVKVVLKNSKRIIVPVIIFFVLIFFAVLLIPLLVPPEFIFGPYSKKSEEEIISFMQNVGKSWSPIFLIPLSLAAFFGFTSFFFSLENHGLLSSFKKSIGAAFNNLRYIGIVILINIIIFYSITNLIPNEVFWGQLVKMVLAQYLALVLISSSLFYYQNVIKKNQKN